MPGVDELEEQHGAVLTDRQVADLVEHKEGGMGEHTQPARQVGGIHLASACPDAALFRLLEGRFATSGP